MPHQRYISRQRKSSTADLLIGLYQYLQLTELLEYFYQIVQTHLKYEKIHYQNPNLDTKICYGKGTRYRRTYQLELNNQHLGTLILYRKTSFNDHLLKTTNSFINSLLYPLHNALLYEKSLHETLTDPLTCLNNRRSFDQTLAYEFNLALRYKHFISLLMMDLDNFKNINDKCGHLFGDRVLKLTAETVTQCIRKSDSIFRYGGEEFIALLRNNKINGATLLAERIRKKVEGLKLTHNNNTISVTISIGVTVLHHQDSLSSFVERADKALYKAKKLGRNKVYSIEFKAN